MPDISTDLNQLASTTTQAKTSLGVVAQKASDFQRAIDDFDRWLGDAKNAFLQASGISLTELTKMTNSLQTMSDNLTMTSQGLSSGEADAAKNITAAAQGGALSGQGLNFA